MSDMRFSRPIKTAARTLLLGLTLAAYPGFAWANSIEAELRAAIIFNLAKYVEWPADGQNASGTFNLCFVGKADAFSDALVALEGKLLKSLPLRVHLKNRNEKLNECHSLVISDSEAEYFVSLLRRLEGMPVLTISGVDKFVGSGGIIGLYAEGNRVRFDINLTAARRNNLMLSSNLLKLARQVLQP